MRVLITGVTGFVGGHLAEHLQGLGHEVWGLARHDLSEHGFGGVFYKGDLLDEPWLQTVLAEAQPELVYHLAAQPSVRASWADPQSTWQANVVGQEHLLRALLPFQPRPLVLIVGSWEEYGAVQPGGAPWSEQSPLLPQSPYALTKAVQDLMGYQYFAGYGLPCIRVRSGNQIGPRQALGFVAADFARSIAEAEAGLREPVLPVGNLEAKRDFTDVRDMSIAYELALRLGEPGDVYNIGSGREVPVQRLLDIYLSLSKVPLKVEVDPAAIRPQDPSILAADISKFQNLSGWKPKIALEQSLQDTLDYWRDRVAARDAAYPTVGGRA